MHRNELILFRVLRFNHLIECYFSLQQFAAMVYASLFLFGHSFASPAAAVAADLRDPYICVYIISASNTPISDTQP